MLALNVGAQYWRSILSQKRIASALFVNGCAWAVTGINRRITWQCQKHFFDGLHKHIGVAAGKIAAAN